MKSIIAPDRRLLKDNKGNRKDVKILRQVRDTGPHELNGCTRCRYYMAYQIDGFLVRESHGIDVTVPQGYNASRIKKDYPSIHFHYVKKELWELGIISI